MNNGFSLMVCIALALSSLGVNDVTGGVVGTSTGYFSNPSEGTISGDNQQNFLFGGGPNSSSSRLTINPSTGVYNISGDFDTPIAVGQFEWENNLNQNDPVQNGLGLVTVDAHWTFSVADPIVADGSIVDMTIYLAGVFDQADAAIVPELYLGNILGASGSVSDSNGTLTATIVGVEIGNGVGEVVVTEGFFNIETWSVEENTISQLNLLAEFSYEPSELPGLVNPEPNSLAIGLGMLAAVALPRRRRCS
jgi:hypothetical protein